MAAAPKAVMGSYILKSPSFRKRLTAVVTDEARLAATSQLPLEPGDHARKGNKGTIRNMGGGHKERVKTPGTWDAKSRVQSRGLEFYLLMKFRRRSSNGIVRP